MTDSDKKEPAKGGGAPSGGGGPKGPHWTLEKIRLLPDGEVKGLKTNAERLAAQSVAEMCEVVLEERRPPPKASTIKYAAITRTDADKREEKECAALLEKCASHLLDKLDLSKETAKRLSAGSKTTTTHSLIGKHGGAKVSGGQKTGKLIFGRYISYRLRDENYHLNIVKFPGNGQIFFEVIAPKRFFSNPVTVTELRPYLEEGERITISTWGQHFDDFNSAAEFYEKLLEQVAPLKNS